MWTEAERDFLSGQQIGRLATLGPAGPQVRPTGFRVNAETSTVDIGGAHLSKTRKWRNIAANDRVAFVVDDVGSGAEFRPRGVEIRGRAELVSAVSGRSAGHRAGFERGGRK